MGSSHCTVPCRSKEYFLLYPGSNADFQPSGKVSVEGDLGPTRASVAAMQLFGVPGSILRSVRLRRAAGGSTLRGVKHGRAPFERTQRQRKGLKVPVNK